MVKTLQPSGRAKKLFNIMITKHMCYQRPRNHSAHTITITKSQYR